MKTESIENEYDTQGREFLTRNGLKLRIALSNTKTASWQPSGNHYRVTLSREVPQWRGGAADNFQPKRVSFDFWGSANDKKEGTHPSEYDVLACISSDIHCPESFLDYCSEYGEDADSRKAYATFQKVSRFSKKLRAFLTEAEAEQLSEIR